jgi:2-haloalkanoic acid dehalogenase type II
VARPTSLRHSSARKFDDVLTARGLPGRVVELSDSTRTAAEAARAVGCELRQIVKSLVFQLAVSKRPVLILASGTNRVDEAWMARYIGEPLARADPEYVRSVSGYAIGGVPPAGHTTTIPTYVDYDLLELPEVWAAAGNPHAVCRLTSMELLDLTGAHPVPVTPLPLAVDGSDSWITFDCYGTLVDWRTGLLQQFDRLAPDGAQPNRLFAAYLREEQALEAGPYMPYRRLMSEAVVRAARSEGLEFSQEEAAEFPDSIPRWPAFEDTRASLASLSHDGFRIGVLSNIDNDLLDLTLRNLGLRADSVVTAEDVRSYKPALKHWIRFLRQTGTRPEKVLHVSGSVEYDILSGRSLGFCTAYVARYGAPPATTEVGLTVGTLSELVQRLRTSRENGPTPLSRSNKMTSGI